MGWDIHQPPTQEQDDVLVEGLLCLLDTHMALYPAGSSREPEQVCIIVSYQLYSSLFVKGIYSN